VLAADDKPGYPFYTASGSPHELGRQHGEQAGRQIDRFLNYQARVLNIDRDGLRARALRFRGLLEETCPHLFEEVGGLAEGAGLPLGDALASQFRGELAQVSEGACTAFAVAPGGTADGKTLIGQNSDNPPELVNFGYVLRLRPEAGPALMMWTFGGMIGYHGFNEHGVAHFANSLGGGPGWKLALSHYPLKRMILEQRSVDDVVRLMRSVPVCSNGNYVLGDGSGAIADVELTSDGPELIDNGQQGFVAHANHYLCTRYASNENHQQSVPDSFSRQTRIEELIRAKLGSVTLEDTKTFLRDHAGKPTGICRHSHDGENHSMLDNSGKTVASLIAEPASGSLHLSCGNPCENEFVTYSLHDAAT